uniref:Probable protein-export membrane protein SecG n=1 Tax=Apophlaea sinclairii TaxID=212746 RepID=A0A1C9CBF9_9FLOR|nr:hypothetical protein Apop_017 [Apophlaea sinclairii]AOM65707.1 hypothetical protein Apop_017 [Apophlaea sinclairii]
MLSILQLVRYSSMLLLILLIITQNPKGEGFSAFNPTINYLGSTRNTESLLSNITWGLVLIFLASTIFLASIDI